MWLPQPTEFCRSDSMGFPRWVMKSRATSIRFSWNLCCGWLCIEMLPLRPVSLHVRSPIQMQMSCAGAPVDNPRGAELWSHYIPPTTHAWRSLQVTETQTASELIPNVLYLPNQGLKHHGAERGYFYSPPSQEDASMQDNSHWIFSCFCMVQVLWAKAACYANILASCKGFWRIKTSWEI